MNTLSLKKRNNVTGLALRQAATNYVLFTESTATYPGVGEQGGLVYCALGLGNETGELAEVFEIPSEQRQAQYERGWKELGDCQWYAARLCAELPDIMSFPMLVSTAEEIYLGLGPDERNIMSGLDLTMKLSKHAGLVQGVVKKMLRDGAMWSPAKAAEKMEELETSLSQFIAVSYHFAERTAPVVGINGGYVSLLRSNVDKLQGRVERGTLHGDGDVR
jgi:hypothetical protein